MAKNLVLQAVVVLISLISATAIVAAYDLDMTVTNLFFVPGLGFPYGGMQPWRALYLFGEWPAFLLAGTALIVLLASFFRAKLRSHRMAALFLVLLLITGPGLLVNSVFKDHWGRARPRQVLAFGGKQQFSQPWQYTGRTEGKSFACGHASVAFYMFAPYFVVRRRNRRVALVWLMCGISFGVIMGIARIAQGGHFVSDVLWSGGIVYLSGLILSAMLLNNEPQFSDTSLRVRGDRF